MMPSPNALKTPTWVTVTAEFTVKSKAKLPFQPGVCVPWLAGSLYAMLAYAKAAANTKSADIVSNLAFI